ncbi:MAG: RNA polymerase sigma factor [Acidimicrobiales bacterium]
MKPLADHEGDRAVPSDNLGGDAHDSEDLRSILVRVLPSGWDRPITSRDQAAFDANVRSAWQVVFHRTASVVRDRREAEEITQEVFCRVLGRIAGDGADAPLRLVYLKTAARNLVYDRWRRQDLVHEVGTAYGEDRSGTPVSVEDEVIGRMDADVVRAAVRSLPTVQRQVLRLRIFEGLTAEATGAVIGREAAAVRQIQHRALLALRSKLADASIPHRAG